jgi:ferredoxin, 2Fe-2S
MYTIRFKFEQPGIPPVTLWNIEPGYSLLEIAVNNHIKLHHDCGGICSCSTCHVYLEKGEEFVAAMNKREKDLIERAAIRRTDSRLACQCLLKEGNGEIDVKLPDQTLISLHITFKNHLN